MNDSKGSAWRKWDLHVHTPDSLVQSYGGPDKWTKFIEELSKLPPEIKVLGINDYIFLDGYRKVLAAKEEGKLDNIELILPVIELRVDTFAGTRSDFSEVNFHVIFSNELSADLIQGQFINALECKFELSPHLHDLGGCWSKVITRESLKDLGQAIINYTPPEERPKFSSPQQEGFNNLCVRTDSILEILDRPHFANKVITAVGKAEWDRMRWNDHSIAVKKHSINCASLVFISSESVAAFENAQCKLTEQGVNNRLLDCSDAHFFSDSTEKDRLGKCFTWIKADPTFEGLRQAVFEYEQRVKVAEARPIEPFLQIKKVEFHFASDSILTRKDRSDIFCFRGDHEFAFSPYLTCIIGGRGTGKSTFLNLLHEKFQPGSTEFFKDNKIHPAGAAFPECITVDGVSQTDAVEFLQQNEIEQFASEHQRLTEAIFGRLRKRDVEGFLEAQEGALFEATEATDKQMGHLKEHHDLSVKLVNAKRELATHKSIVASFEDEQYKRINNELAAVTKELQGLTASRIRVEAVVEKLSALLPPAASPSGDANTPMNDYEKMLSKIRTAVEACIVDVATDSAFEAARQRVRALNDEIAALRQQLGIFLRERGVSAENLADAGRATERIAKLDEDIETLRKEVSALATAIGAFTSRREVADRYIETVRSLLSPINDKMKNLGDEVKPIELQFHFNNALFKEAMIEYISCSIGLIEGRAARPDFVEGKLRDVEFSALTTMEEMVLRIPLDESVYGKTLRAHFSEAINFEVMKMKAELCLLDVFAFGQIHVLYDGKPVENSSFGQRCTAVIVVLLLLGNTPLVIDEPEAHLDSSLIAKYLVELVKDRKQHRQIIFATHNANFVINGDSELVHCLSMDRSGVTQSTSTTIENLENRPLLLALEGGKKAFLRRERRYAQGLED